MNSILYAIVFLITAAFSDNEPNVNLKVELKSLMKKIHIQIYLLRLYELNKLESEILPLESDYFLYKIKYDEPILSMRKNLFKEISQINRDIVTKCHKNFHKGLDSLINSEAKLLETYANDKVSDIRRNLTALSTVLFDIEASIENELEFSLNLKMDINDKVMLINQQMGTLLNDVLEIPSIIRDKWTYFENSIDLQKLVNQTVVCYHTKYSKDQHQNHLFLNRTVSSDNFEPTIETL